MKNFKLIILLAMFSLAFISCTEEEDNIETFPTESQNIWDDDTIEIFSTESQYNWEDDSIEIFIDGDAS